MRKKRTLIACAPPNDPRARTACHEVADVPTVRSGRRSTPATTAIQCDEHSAAELCRPGASAVMRDYDRRGIRRSTRLVLRRMDGCEPGLRVNEMHPVDEGRKIANGRPGAAIAGGHDAYRGIEGRARQARVH